MIQVVLNTAVVTSAARASSASMKIAAQLLTPADMLAEVVVPAVVMQPGDVVAIAPVTVAMIAAAKVVSVLRSTSTMIMASARTAHVVAAT